MRFAFVVVSLLSAGCRVGFTDALGDAGIDASTAPPPSFTSGSRIRAIVVDGDGIPSAARVGWFDRTLAEECQVLPGEDGIERCLPSRVFGGRQFSDPACTVPLMQRRELLDVASCPSAALLGTFNLGNGSYRTFQVGANHAGTIYQNGAGCVVVQNDGSFYAAGAVVPPEQFAAFTEQVTPAGSLGYVEKVSADGASELSSSTLVETATGARCTVIEQRFGEAACVPELPSGSLVFADAACSELAVALFDSVPSPLAVVQRGSLCGSETRTVSAGAELPSYYNVNNGVCSVGATSASLRAWRVDAEQPVEAIATATLVADGSGSLARAHWDFNTGHSLPNGLFDRRNNDVCAPISLKDTLQTVCAPMWSGLYAVAYSDAGCINALPAWPSCEGTWRSTWYPTAPFQQTCNGIGYYIRRYDVPVSAPTYMRDGASCVPTEAGVTLYLQSSTNYDQAAMIPLARRTE